MPNKKKGQQNAFAVFMKELQEKLAKQGLNYNMRQMADIANPKWKEMSLAERKPYEEMSKAMRREGQDSGRRAADGTLIRENEEREAERQELENRTRQEVMDFVGLDRRLSTEEFIATNRTKKLYFISFNVLCRVKETDTYVPIEIGLVEYTIKDGVRKEYHTIIDTGGIPRGCTGDAKQHSETTHHIDIFDSESYEKDYYKIWQTIMDIISPLNGSEDLPPLFCLKSDIAQNLGSLEWLAERAGAEDSIPSIKVWDATHLYMDLRAGAQSPVVSYVVANQELSNTSFDYTPGLKCAFHEEDDNVHCALRKVKSLCCVISDLLCRLFNVAATERHLPSRASSAKPYEVYRPAFYATPLANERGVGRGRPQVSSNYSSRPGSTVHEEVGPNFLASSNQRTPKSEQMWRNTSMACAYDFSSNELEKESEIENLNPSRTQSVASSAGSVVQLRQPMSPSIALSLARARAAPTVAPGKGIGRGQRKE